LHQKCEDENTIRIKAAKRHNEYGDVCGNCMKVLYKNNNLDLNGLNI